MEMRIVKNTAVRSGIGFGSALAMVISFTVNRSILWAVFHGILGWIYVVFKLLTGGY